MSKPPTLSLSRGGYEPGERARVDVRWELSYVPRKVELSLLREIRAAHEHERHALITLDVAERPRAGGERRPTAPYRGEPGARSRGEAPPLAEEDWREVEVPLPRGPYSFEGKLISVRYSLELRIFPGEGAVCVPLTLGPGGAAIEAREEEGKGSETETSDDL